MHIHNRQNYSSINFNLVLTLSVGLHLREYLIEEIKQDIIDAY
jgi:hypothetical protein